MSPRVGKLIKGIVAGKTQRQAALDAGYGRGINPEGASVQASRTLKKANVAEALEKALDEAGMTIDATAKIVAEAGNATKLQSIAFKVHEVPDHAIRLDAAKTAAKWRGIDSSEEGGMALNIGFFMMRGGIERGLDQ